jgi:tetratricopeptide (TPR) repeat protein
MVRKDQGRLARWRSTLVISSAVSLVLGLGVDPATNAQNVDRDVHAATAEASERFRAGEFDAALGLLEPWLGAELDRTSRDGVRMIATRVLHARGEEHFRKSRLAEAIGDFDREVALDPDIAPEHWQRGIAYYYAEQFDQGARQFELHRAVNPQDVENSAWHFLCIVRGTRGSVEKARKALIPVTEDARAPMAEVQSLFAGTATPEDVQRAGAEGGDSGRFYADLYVGLYFEALGRGEESLRLIERAAENPVARDSYMGDVARVHVTLRKDAAAGR